MDCTEAYREHIMYSFNGFCKVVIRYAAINAWRDRNRRRQRKVLPSKHIRRISQITLRTIPRYNLRSDNHTHQRRACCSPVIPAGEKERNHLSLLFWELHTTGNRGFIRTMQEYSMALYPQCLTDVAGGNGGAFAWGILNLYRTKPLSG